MNRFSMLSARAALLSRQIKAGSAGSLAAVGLGSTVLGLGGAAGYHALRSSPTPDAPAADTQAAEAVIGSDSPAALTTAPTIGNEVQQSLRSKLRSFMAKRIAKGVDYTGSKYLDRHLKPSVEEPLA